MGNNVNIDPYAELGVSSTKEGVHEAVKNLSKGLYPGAFCQITPMPRNLPDEISNAYAQVIHSDGVGTKSNIAYLAMKEGLGEELLYNLAQDAIVMNTDDMACVGVTDNIFISNHIARNSNAINNSALSKIIQGYSNFFEKMEKLDIHLYNTGGETADVNSYTTTMGIDVTASAFINKDSIIDCSNIGAGECIVGLSSTGTATYEEKENSGIRSNGLTLGINTLLCPDYRKYPETMDWSTNPEKLFRGPYHLEDYLPNTSLTIGEALSSPTRTYLPIIRDTLQSDISVDGIIHCSGGGLTKCINFGKGITYVKDNLTNLPVPPIFQAIQEAGNISNYHMYKTFNMGIGMEIIVKNANDAYKIINIARKYNIWGYIAGYTEVSKDGQNKVVIGKLTYTK